MNQPRTPFHAALRRRTLFWLACSCLALALPLPAGWASAAGSQPKASPEEFAARQYNRGLKARENALRKLENSRREDRMGWLRRLDASGARSSWESAVGYFEEAVANKADFHEAYSELGYALRKLERYDASLSAYQQSLKLEPTYAPALEYVGELYLILGRLEDVKRTYLALEASDPLVSLELMDSIRSWLRDDAEALSAASPQSVAAFREWVGEHSAVSEGRSDPNSERRARSW